MLLGAHFLLAVVGEQLSVLICRLDALHAGAEGFHKLALEVFAHHVGVVVAKVLPVRRLDAASREHLSNG